MAEQNEVKGRLFGPQYHRVPDEIVVTRLRDDLHGHIGSNWWALVLFNDGRWVSRGARPGSTPPSMETIDLLRRIAVVLNLQADRGGHWVVALDQGKHEVVALWRDGDGDIHAVIEFDQKVHALHGWIDDQFAAQGQSAINVFMAQQAQAEIAPGQQIRRALGEKPTLN